MNVELASVIALVALTFILVEVALRLPFGASLEAMVKPSLRSISVMRAPGISEHWKERAMLLYANRTLCGVKRFTMNLLRVVVVAVGFGAAIAVVVPGFAAFSLGVEGLVLTLVVATGWIALRNGLVGGTHAASSDYAPVEQIMHRVVLGNEAVAEIVFGVDQKLSRADASAAKTNAHVFVAGLARAGTTVLTRGLQESGAFGSLTYRDMPFVMAPNLWKLMPGRSGQGVSAKERAHGDGVIVDIDSPESLEEPFWRVFDRKSYLKTDRLLPHKPDATLVRKYQCYIAAILHARGAKRYLAKNNNNILRLGMLAEAFPNAHILVPYRHPLTQAASLLSQHERFCTIHDKDPFARDYMGWLAHHEFGSDRRFFDVGGQRPCDPSTLDYWLAQWCNVYGWLLKTAPEKNARFICYEEMCNDPEAWRQLADELNLRSRQVSPFRATQTPKLEKLSPVEAHALEIYTRLLSRSQQCSKKTFDPI